MADGLRTVRLVTSDESLLATARAAVQALEGWDFNSVKSVDELLERPPVAGDVLLLDGMLRSENVYEGCRRLAGRTRCRTFVVVPNERDSWAAPIASFCGASGTLSRPLSAGELRAELEKAAPRADAPQNARRETEQPSPKAPLPQDLMRDLAGQVDHKLIDALSDPETNLFNYAFLGYKLEEEFKRAVRFDVPLACVMLGFEGQVSEQTLRELSGIILVASRDTDVLGRFDESAFLFLLPNTGQDGAEIMARRVEELAQSQGLRDLVGDPLQISVGISFVPHPALKRHEDMFSSARKAFQDALHAGGGVVTSA